MIVQNILKFNQLSKYNYLIPSIFNSTSSYLSYEKDPGPAFNDPLNQKILKSITRADLQKIFKKRAVSNNSITYKFMTTEQVENEIKNISEQAETFLHMPPIVQVLQDKHKIISKDPEMNGFSDSPFVIVDITFGVKNSSRKIVVRNTDGTLENASLSIRKRVNQIFFPSPGRKLHTPKLFEKTYFEKCLNENKHEFLLNRICVQYEPYEQNFHEYTEKVYLDINEKKIFDSLRSTRHFGPMAFFYAWHKIIDNLLIEMIQKDFLENGVELICLLYNLHNHDYDKKMIEKIKTSNDIQSQFKPFKSKAEDIIEETVPKSLDDFKLGDLYLEFIDRYAKECSPKRTQVELALQTYKDHHEQQRKLLIGLNKAHGIS